MYNEISYSVHEVGHTPGPLVRRLVKWSVQTLVAVQQDVRESHRPGDVVQDIHIVTTVWTALLVHPGRFLCYT